MKRNELAAQIRQLLRNLPDWSVEEDGNDIRFFQSQSNSTLAHYY